WDALEAHFLPEAALVFSTPSGPKRMTPAKFIELVRKNVEGKEIFEERMKAGSVRAHENLATVWSSFEGREGNGTDIRIWSGVDAFTLVKVEGRGGGALIALSQDPPPPARCLRRAAADLIPTCARCSSADRCGRAPAV